MVNSGNTYGERVSRLVSWGHWFSFFNIIIAMLIGSRFIAQSPWPDTVIGQAYLLISWFGHFAFLVFALYILVLFPLTFVIPSRKLLRLVSVCFTTLCLTLLLLDTQAYEKLHLHLNPVVWELLLSKEKTAFNAQWQYLFAAVPILFLIQIVISEWIWKKQRSLSRKKIGKPVTIIFFLCFLSSHLIYIWADAFFYRPITSQRTNFPLSYPMTAKSFMEKHGLLDRSDYLERLEEYGSGNGEVVNYPLEPMKYDGLGKKYNVLMVMVDNLRSDMLTQQVMPSTFEFAKNNQNFVNHYSATNNIYGVFSLFYGLPSNYSASIKAQDTQPLIIDSMAKRHYQMAAFSDDKFEGSELYDEIFSSIDVQKNTAQDHDSNNEIVDDWKTWLSTTSNKPWFSYVELSNVERFENNTQVLNQFTPKSKNAIAMLKASYQSAAFTADQSIQNILTEIDSKNLLNNTIVVITSNHGMEFNDTNSNTWGSDSNFSRYQLQVPMVVHWPDKKPTVYTQHTSHLDLSATLMQDLFETSSNPYDFSSGRNLFDTSERPWILAGDNKNIALVTKDTTTVVDQFGNYKVYDKNYKRQKHAKPKLSFMLQGLSELKRFYHQPN